MAPFLLLLYSYPLFPFHSPMSIKNFLSSLIKLQGWTRLPCKTLSLPPLSPRLSLSRSLPLSLSLSLSLRMKWNPYLRGSRQAVESQSLLPGRSQELLISWTVFFNFTCFNFNCFSTSTLTIFQLQLFQVQLFFNFIYFNFNFFQFHLF